MLDAQVPPLQPDDTAGVRPFRCERFDAADAVAIVVSGELDLATAPQVDTLLRDAQTDAPLVVLDLRQLDFIDSQGVRLAIEADRRARRKGSELVIVRGARVSWLFEMVGIDRLLRLVDEPPASVL